MRVTPWTGDPRDVQTRLVYPDGRVWDVASPHHRPGAPSQPCRAAVMAAGTRSYSLFKWTARVPGGESLRGDIATLNAARRQAMRACGRILRHRG